jgi:translation initiation factor IF-3
VHDLDIKLKQFFTFLKEGHRVKCVLKFKGRELTHLDRGDAVFSKIGSTFMSVGVNEPVKKEGKSWFQIWMPKKSS